MTKEFFHNLFIRICICDKFWISARVTKLLYANTPYLMNSVAYIVLLVINRVVPVRGLKVEKNSFKHFIDSPSQPILRLFFISFQLCERI